MDSEATNSLLNVNFDVGIRSGIAQVLNSLFHPNNEQKGDE